MSRRLSHAIHRSSTALVGPIALSLVALQMGGAYIITAVQGHILTSSLELSSSSSLSALYNYQNSPTFIRNGHQDLELLLLWSPKVGSTGYYCHAHVRAPQLAQVVQGPIPRRLEGHHFPRQGTRQSFHPIRRSPRFRLCPNRPGQPCRLRRLG
ncbi:hypothetical protein AG1IA_09720 [Rhizoctonia solani AG-1 IA]|uniref:Uncharacterized protein n=1 Tax=Thanatephorus cucumeris (strain AG1-IA) TaxID=983506 RepID=L8WIR9_THACA|nr:hypothetical protein AG1IA_09720 [Rhizoctonia solani AG-1 IA]